MITPVILCGGAGTRLWPLSRADSPKQLLALIGERTMLQATVARTAGRVGYATPLVVTGRAHAGQVAEQLGDLAHRLLVEPAARNTAPAIALAAHAAGPDATLLVMPSDHVVADPDGFIAAVARAAPVAAEGWLVTFGIAPDGPETGYGYIRRGRPLAPGVHAVEAFIEKPTRDRAQAMLREGGHDWNGGIFLFRSDAFLAELERQRPDIAAAAAGGDFAACPAESIDYAVMEGARRIAVVPVSMGWSDIGSWDALRLAHHADLDGNVIQGPVVAVDVANCLLRSEGPVLAAVGVHGLNIVATDDAVLVTAIGHAQQVKAAVERLKGDPVLSRPARTRHHWGEAIVHAESSALEVRELVLHAGATWPGLAVVAELTVIDGALADPAIGPGGRHGLDAGAPVVAGPAPTRLLLVHPPIGVAL